jgi:hypothetical protein
MIPNEFEYFAPATIPDALTLLADPAAKVLAGGMSLVPMMKMRLASLRSWSICAASPSSTRSGSTTASSKSAQW